MQENLTVFAPARDARVAPHPEAAAARGGTPLPAEPLVALLLDELDYGVILLRDAVQVVHLNHAARVELRSSHRIEVVDGSLRARRAADAQVLGDAMHAAAHGGLRKLVTLGADGECVALAIIPVGTPSPGMASLTVAVLGRRRLCERISVQWFARTHGLTPAEAQVLEMLCDGLDPGDIAKANEVGMATVRTQVNAIRGKTGATSIRGLLRQLALLPPLVSSLRC